MQNPHGNFADLIAIRRQTINRFTSALKNGEVKPERVGIVQSAILDAWLQASIAQYSLALEKNSILDSVELAINVFKQGFKWAGFDQGYGQYDQMVWLVSLAILTDVDLDDFKKITQVISRDGVKDKLLDFLIKYKQPDWPGNNNNFIQKSPYQSISTAIDTNDNAEGIKALERYLQKNVWYKGHEDAAWYDSHKNTKVNVYFGYWAWEAAALVKAKGWDDEKLKTTEYYPYEAVHW